MWFVFHARKSEKEGMSLADGSLGVYRECAAAHVMLSMNKHENHSYVSMLFTSLTGRLPGCVGSGRVSFSLSVCVCSCFPHLSSHPDVPHLDPGDPTPFRCVAPPLVPGSSVFVAANFNFGCSCCYFPSCHLYTSAPVFDLASTVYCSD